ncbi:MAG: hypothetical protein KAS71_15180 [Bacteroidales bacterium]|nr:hypothetical protein [Bacteroidales bacterium]
MILLQNHSLTDLNMKLEAWELFYIFNGPHVAFNDKTPFEAMRARSIAGNYLPYQNDL